MKNKLILVIFSTCILILSSYIISSTLYTNIELLETSEEGDFQEILSKGEIEVSYYLTNGEKIVAEKESKTFMFSPENKIFCWTNCNLYPDFQIYKKEIKEDGEVISIIDLDIHKDFVEETHSITEVYKNEKYNKITEEVEYIISEEESNLDVLGSNGDFSVDWVGELLIIEEGDYSFYLDVSGGVRVILNETEIFSDWTNNERSKERKFDINLINGTHSLRILYWTNEYYKNPNLYWESSKFDKTIVPSGNLIFKNGIIEEYKELKGFSASLFLESYDIDYSVYPSGTLYLPKSIENNQPIILVHGLNGKYPYWSYLPEQLTDFDNDVWQFYYADANVSNFMTAGLFERAVDRALRDYSFGTKANVISHSMGALVVLGYVSNLGKSPYGGEVLYKGDIENVILMGAPIHGAYLANRVIKRESAGLICGLFVDPDDPESQAYLDLSVGSEFSWLLHEKGLNPNINYLSIAGIGNDIWCLPYEADDSDGFVSASSASLLDFEVPLALLQANHNNLRGHCWTAFGARCRWNLWKGFYYDDTMADLIDKFLEGASTTTLKSKLYDNEYYIKPNDPNSDQTPFNEGGVSIKFDTFNLDDITSVKLKNGIEEYNLTKNDQTGIFYHFNTGEFTFIDCIRDRTRAAEFGIKDVICLGAIAWAMATGDITTSLTSCVQGGLAKFGKTLLEEDLDICLHTRPIDYGFTLPQETYDLFVNNVETEFDIEIKPTQTTMKEIVISLPCITPIDGMSIFEDTTLCQGEHNIPNGFSIGASNIELDCDGATLVGENQKQYGIRIEGNVFDTNFTNIKIKNCNLKNYFAGILISHANNIELINNTVLDSKTGAYIGNPNSGEVYNIEVRDSRFENNFYRAINLDTAKNSLITDNEFYDNGESGNSEKQAIRVTGQNNTIYNNIFDSTGINDNNIWNNVYCVAGVGNTYLDGASGPVCEEETGSKLPIESWNGYGIREGKLGEGYSRFLIPDYEAYWGDNEVNGTGIAAEEIAEMYKPYYSLASLNNKPLTTYYRIVKGKDPYANNRSAYLIIYFNYYKKQCCIYGDHINDAEPVFIWFENVGEKPYRVAYDFAEPLSIKGHYVEVLRTYAWSDYSGFFNQEEIQQIYTQLSSYFPQGKQNFSNYERDNGDSFAQLELKNLDDKNFNETHIKLRINNCWNSIDSGYGSRNKIDGNYTLNPFTDGKLTEWYKEEKESKNVCGDLIDEETCIFSYDISDPFHGLFWENYNVCEPEFVSPVVSINNTEIGNSKHILHVNNLQVNDNMGGNMNGLWKDRFRIIINDSIHFPNLAENYNHSKYNLMFNIDSSLELEGNYDMYIEVRDNLENENSTMINAYIDNVAPRISLIYPDSLYWIEDITANLLFEIHEEANCSYELRFNGDGSSNSTLKFLIESNLKHNVTINYLVDTLENESYTLISTCQDGHDNQGTNSVEFEVDACKPNWISYNTSCFPSGEMMQYYVDDNSCRLQPHRNESVPKNITSSCNDLCTPNSPINNTIYSSRRILFDITATEKLAKIEYIDYTDRRPRWKPLCSKCDSYKREKSFTEGEHEIVVRCTPYFGDDEIHEMEFTNDYKPPRISKTSPSRNSYTNGSGFYVKYREDNPVRVSVNYNPTVDLDLEGCVKDGRYEECYVDLNLSDYDGEEIEYYFVVEDIAGNMDESRKVKVKVDTTPPVLNNPNSFWEQGTGRYSKYLYFDMDITEENFDEVRYYYEDSRERIRDTRLCSRLRDGECVKRRRMGSGEIPLRIEILDEAGNGVWEEIEFEAF
ncbi:MAG: right-handed parallel beta-helix repeat-containing protein [Nanoarchaeota archaeon]|nr:right-handed parallel beta-helix repeat-containing protein [Nanoarchaeota archaeon]